jgi:signal peptidase II
MGFLSSSLMAQAIISALLIITALVIFLLHFARGRLWVAVSLGIVLADQIIKYVVVRLLRAGEEVPLPGSASVVYSENRLLGFGLPQEGLLSATLASLAALMLLYLSLRRRGYRMGFLAELSGALIVGGCAGILIDRIRLGFVIDWLDFGPGSDFIYNLADLAILAGAALFAARSTQLIVRKARRSFAASGSNAVKPPVKAVQKDPFLTNPEETGRKAAQEMAARFGKIPPMKMAETLGLRIEHRPLPPPGFSALRVRSEYLGDCGAIVLYDEPLRELSLLLSAKRPDLAQVDLEAVHIAHEIFHHLSPAQSAAAEKAAASFAAELLGLRFPPEELDNLYASDDA